MVQVRLLEKIRVKGELVVININSGTSQVTHEQVKSSEDELKSRKDQAQVKSNEQVKGETIQVK